MRLSAHPPTPGTRVLRSASVACRTGECSPCSRAFPPPSPSTFFRCCSNGSSVLCPCPTPPQCACGPSGLKPSPAGPHFAGHRGGLPVLVQKVSRRVWGLRLRRADPRLALAPRVMRPSAEVRTPAPWLRISGAQYPAHLAPCLHFTPCLATCRRELGAEWFATPFS